MNTITQLQEESALRQRAAAGDLSAADELATALYNNGDRKESADLYLQALQGGFYKSNQRPQSDRNFFHMVDGGLLPPDSPAVQYVNELRSQVVQVEGKATAAAGRVGIATFIGYMAIVFGGGITGPLRDFSLVIAAVLSWAAWKIIISSFSDQ